MLNICILKETEYDTFTSNWNTIPCKGLFVFILSLLNQSFHFLLTFCPPSFPPSLPSFLGLGRQGNIVKYQNNCFFGCFRFNQLCLHLTSNILLKDVVKREVQHFNEFCLCRFPLKDEKTLTTHRLFSQYSEKT